MNTSCQRCAIISLILITCASSYAEFGRSTRRSATPQPEPNVNVASQWWSPMPNVWTPVGWKNHLFRFNVLHTGVILAEPHPVSPFGAKHTEPFAGLGMQVTITPSANGAIPAARSEPYQLQDMNANLTGNQGWADHDTPVLWTEWRQPHVSLNGVTLRQETFGYVPGAGDVQTGIEPLFGWVRISVAEKLEMIPRSQVGVLIRINALHTGLSMWALDNLVMYPERSAYPRALSAEMIGDHDHRGCLLTEPDGKVRLAVLPGKATNSVTFIDRPANGKDYYLHITMPAKKGAFVDLLLPFVPMERSLVEVEMRRGYDTALSESDAYWAILPSSAARIQTPEPLVNRVFQMTPKLAEIIAQKNPETGQYSALCGSLNYASVWATPHSMQLHMLLDPLGYHAVAERYLKIYQETQGTSKAPGPSYEKHPGYLSAPRSLSSVDWITDHGAILYAICQHGLLSGDQKFIADYTPTVLRACDFIRDSRRATNHTGAKGVLPPASSTDRDVPEQGLWSDGWNYKGLTSAVKFLRRAGNPRAGEFKDEAEDYKRAFQAALREMMKTQPTWHDSRGNPHPLVPTAFINGDVTHPFYLDTGPLFLVFAGLMDADDELMRNILLFFREGPNTRTFDPSGNFHQPAVLTREISSCEPCYSWNIYHSWQSADRFPFLEGMYSLITGGMSRQTFISSEHRGGISGTQFVAPLAVSLMRLAVIDDQIKEDELHLLRLCPQAWISSTEETVFENMPTEFGPVNLRLKKSADGETLTVSFSGQWREKPNRVVLHTPPVPGMTKLLVNGKRFRAGQPIELKSF